jgi:hypothetical protein
VGIAPYIGVSKQFMLPLSKPVRILHCVLNDKGGALRAALSLNIFSCALYPYFIIFIL